MTSGCERFSQFPLVQLIDLDAAIGTGDNRALIQDFVGRLPCQVGGGIRSVERAQEVLVVGRAAGDSGIDADSRR